MQHPLIARQFLFRKNVVTFNRSEALPKRHQQADTPLYKKFWQHLLRRQKGN